MHHGVSFLGQFGNDDVSSILRRALTDNDVNVDDCGESTLHPTGRGYVLIVPHTGEVCAVISGGSNLHGWERWGDARTTSSYDENVAVGTDDGATRTGNDVADDDGERVASYMSDDEIRSIVSRHSLLLLQCEVPNIVNVRLARACREMGVNVLLDAGGEDRVMGRELLECANYLIPNETELERLARHYDDDDDDDEGGESGDLEHGMSSWDAEIMQARIGPAPHLPAILRSVRKLQRHGASNVLVTLGSRGSLLVKGGGKGRSSSSRGSRTIYQPPVPLPPGTRVVDETGAGDCYRAGFAIALLERCGGDPKSLDDVDDEVLVRCMEFASAAGALAVTREGAVPSIPSRDEVDELLGMMSDGRSARDDTTPEEEGDRSSTAVEIIPRGGGSVDDNDRFPFLFGSRINSSE